MTATVRAARPDDVPGIVEWTADTFDWGDYVPDRIDDWIEEPESEVMVCVDSSDTPIAVAHAVMLSATEGWLEAARVHPEHRRSGLGTALNHAGVRWAAGKGAAVVRLATEASNHAAHAQVEALGYRATSSWLYAWIEVPPDHRSLDEVRLRPAPGSDVDAAWMFWSTSDLAHGGRGFLARGWQWRKARPDDLAEASATGQFFQNPAGWVIAEQPQEDVVRTGWMATTKGDAPRLLDGLIGMAADRDAAGLSIKVPNIPWAAEALVRAGGDRDEILVYSLPVPTGD